MNSNESSRDFLLEDIYSGEKFVLRSDESVYKCGRKPSNKILTQSVLASREHCIFYRTDSGLGVADVGSFNGTYINGVIRKPNVIHELAINDLIGLGHPGQMSDSFDSELPSVYKLKLYIKDQPKMSVNTDNRHSKEMEKNTSENKRRLSRDFVDYEVPCKRIKEETPFSDIADVESNDNKDKANGIKVSEVELTTTSRDPRLNRIKSIDPSTKKNDNSRSAKRVSFNDQKTKIIVYKIKRGNILKKCPSKDAPLMMKKSKRRKYTRTKVCPQLEQFLLQIFHWNPNWLKEQKQFGRIPRVVNEERLIPTLSKYETYEDYYNVTEPLLTLELWHRISREFEIGENNFKNLVMSSIVKNSISLTTIPSTDIPVTTLMLEVVVSKREIDLQSHPVYGDLVFFEYVSTETGKESFSKLFAYVTSIRQTVVTSLTYFNRDLINFVDEPYAVLTYTMMTKPLDHTHIQTNQVHGLRKISYLCSNIRMIQGLQYLSISPILNQILHPKIEDYQLSLASNFETYSLVTKDKLNAKQLEAVVRITDTVVRQLPKICLIDGPPGTGKSKVIVNLVTEILYGNGRYQHTEPLRILVCSSSNAAIDEIVLRLLEIRRSISESNEKIRFKMVRTGQIEAMHPLVRKVALTELAKPAVKRTIARYLSRLNDDNIEEEKRALQARINALELELLSVQSACSLNSKRTMRKLDDVKVKYDLLMSRESAEKLNSMELVNLKKATEETLLVGADVIACTLESCYTNQMESVFAESDEAISVCIVDEATQCAEAETLVPLILGVRTLVLVGDSNQVPTTMKSERARQFGLDQSLFSRIQNSFVGQKNNPIIHLDTQYRMSYPVALWPNGYFYAGALKNSAKLHNLPFYFYKVIDIDSTQSNHRFSNHDDGATFMANLVYTLMTVSNIKNVNLPVRIGVITMYDSQRALIMEKIEKRIGSLSNRIKMRIILDVNTVDRFQGQERDVIIVSCMDSEGIGFLSDHQRLYVALTRAKHSLMFCGNFKTFWRDSMWNALLSDAQSRRVYVKINAIASPKEIKPYVVR